MTLFKIRFTGRHLLFLFLLGAVFGSIGDFCHVISATTGYPDYGLMVPFLDLPYWVPLEFGLATVILGVFHPVVDSSLRKNGPTRPGASEKKWVLLGVMALILVWGASGFLLPHLGWIKDVILAGMALSIWYFLDRTATGLLVAILTAIVGTSVEIFFVNNGVFNYAEHSRSLFGVASWLPWIYVTAAVAVGNVSGWFLRKGNGR